MNELRMEVGVKESCKKLGEVYVEMGRTCGKNGR